jgi:hypothetical protein
MSQFLWVPAAVLALSRRSCKTMRYTAEPRRETGSVEDLLQTKISKMFCTIALTFNTLVIQVQVINFKYNFTLNAVFAVLMNGDKVREKFPCAFLGAGRIRHIKAMLSGEVALWLRE